MQQIRRNPKRASPPPRDRVISRKILRRDVGVSSASSVPDCAPTSTVFAKNPSSRIRSSGSLSPDFLFQVFVKNIRPLLLWGAACTLACMLFFSIWRFGTASVVMSLNYEQSVSGKTPNGTRFNPSEFLTQDYLQAILEHVGLQNSLTTQELSDFIRISPADDRIATDEDGYYITSSYDVTVSLPVLYWHLISPSDLLSKTCEVYQEKFASEYRVTADALKLVDDYSDLDFEEMGSYFSMMIRRIRNYLDVRISQNRSYISETGQSYSSIRKQLQNFETYTLTEFNSFIWNNGVSKDPSRQLHVLDELNRTLRWEEQRCREKSAALMDVLQLYDNRMASSVLIPTYDDSGAFYMSRTKAGIDDLALEADDLLTAAVRAQKFIAVNQSKIRALERPADSYDQQAAQSLAEALSEQLSGIVSSILSLDADCYANRISNYLVFTSYEHSFVQRCSFKMSVLIAVCACLFRYAAAVLSANRAVQKQQKPLYDDDRTSATLNTRIMAHEKL